MRLSVVHLRSTSHQNHHNSTHARLWCVEIRQSLCSHHPCECVFTPLSLRQFQNTSWWARQRSQQHCNRINRFVLKEYVVENPAQGTYITHKVSRYAKTLSWCTCCTRSQKCWLDLLHFVSLWQSLSSTPFEQWLATPQPFDDRFLSKVSGPNQRPIFGNMSTRRWLSHPYLQTSKPRMPWA